MSNKSLTGHPIAYRPDIDGLRAVAVLSVIVFHLFPENFTGGYVGVDVFFVISGYLITSIILKNLENSSFSFVDFYAKRAKRIFPSLVIVLLTSFLAGWIFLLKDEFIQLAKHTYAGAFFVPNIVFWKESGNYFDTALELKPLIHLWSLGVEEQFYFFWPLTLYLASKYKLNYLKIIAFVFACSFLLNVTQVKNFPIDTFYLPWTRLWELLIGSALSYYVIVKKLKPTSQLANPMSFIGLCMILFAAFLFSQKILFPGWWALIPTLGALFIISAGQRAWINQYILSLRPFVYVGLISYPMYLWHWPMISFIRIVDPSILSIKTKLLIILATIIVSSMTYYLLEKPIKKRGIVIALFLAGALGAVGFLGKSAYQENIAARSKRFNLERIDSAVNDSFSWPPPGWQIELAGKSQLYKIGAGKNIILFIGDSNMQQYWPRMEKVFITSQRKNISLVFAAEGSCPPIPNVREKKRPHCFDFTRDTYEYAKNPNVKSIVIAAFWFDYFFNSHNYFELNGAEYPLGIGKAGSDLAYKEFAQKIHELVGLGKKILIVSNIPTSSDIDPRYMIKRSFSYEAFKIDEGRFIRKSELDQKYGEISKKIEEIAKENRVSLVDPTKSLCQNDICPAFDDLGNPIYRDEAHIRNQFIKDKIDFLDFIVLDGSL